MQDDYEELESRKIRIRVARTEGEGQPDFFVYLIVK
jgi:hypothetical protein